eukprot:m.144658 g.144658  ORF g.144658 m.144658 type:complete len:108 (+) comp30388_c0_seq1:38-361(+)
MEQKRKANDVKQKQRCKEIEKSKNEEENMKNQRIHIKEPRSKKKKATKKQKQKQKQNKTTQKAILKGDRVVVNQLFPQQKKIMNMTIQPTKKDHEHDDTTTKQPTTK